MMKNNILIVVAVLLSGCVSVPVAQNPEEYKASFSPVNSEGESASHLSEVVPMGIDEATGTLRKRLVPCLNGSDDKKKGATIAPAVWTAKMHKINSRHSQMTVQVGKSDKVGPGVEGEPSTGPSYMAVIDLNYLDKDKIKVNYYYANSVKHDVIEPAMGLLNGEKITQCKFE